MAKGRRSSSRRPQESGISRSPRRSRVETLAVDVHEARDCDEGERKRKGGKEREDCGSRGAESVRRLYSRARASALLLSPAAAVVAPLASRLSPAQRRLCKRLLRDTSLALHSSLPLDLMYIPQSYGLHCPLASAVLSHASATDSDSVSDAGSAADSGSRGGSGFSSLTAAAAATTTGGTTTAAAGSGC